MAVNFGGTSSFRQTSATGMPGSVWTAAFWLKLNSLPASGDYFNLINIAGGTGELYLEVPGVDKIVQVNGLEGGPALTTGQWYRVAAVRNGSSSALYVSSAATGALTAVATGAMSSYPTSPNVLNVGSSGATGASVERLDGRMINFKLWSVALDATQIATELGAYTVANATGLLRAHRWDATASGTPDSGSAGAFTTPNGAPVFVSDTPSPLASTTHSETGGAAASGAGSGAKVVAPANFINKTGGAAASGASSGAKSIGKAWAKTGGAAPAAAGSGAKVVDAHLLPSQVLDLSYWHLTTPADSGEGDAEQINQPELDDYESEFFQVDAQGRVLCYAPVDGFTTSGASGATRTELRQRRKGTYALAGWDPTVNADRWQMTITTYVDASGVSGGTTPRDEAICVQIHGAGDSPIPLILAAEYHVTPARIRIYKNGPGFANPVTSITPDTAITIRIRVENDRLKLWAIAGQATDLPDPVTTTAPYDWPISDFTDQVGWYFKAGIYNKTQISSGSSGATEARIAYLNVLEPGDAEESFSTTYEKTGGASSPPAGSGAKTFDEHDVHVETGGAAGIASASGAKALTSATIHATAGGASPAAAASGAAVRVSAAVHAKTGGSTTSAAGGGSTTLEPAAVHTKAGGGATAAAGAGARSLVRSFTGGASTSPAGSGAKSTASATTYDKTGGAATLAAGNGQRDISVVHARTGGAAPTAAATGELELYEPTTYDRTGGATLSPAASGASDIQPAMVHDRAGGAVASAVADGTRQHVRVRSGAAGASAAGSGDVEQVTAARHERVGGAVAAAAGSGQLAVEGGTVHDKAGGGTGLAAGSGARATTSAEVHAKAGGATAVGAGICLVEVIPATVHTLSGGAVLVTAGTGRGRVGGRMRAGVPVTVGQLRSGTPARR